MTMVVVGMTGNPDADPEPTLWGVGRDVFLGDSAVITFQ